MIALTVARFTVASVGLVFLSGSGLARAQSVIFSTLGASPDSSIEAGQGDLHAQSFTTGPSASYLSKVTLSLSSATGPYQVSIWSEASGEPDISLYTLAPAGTPTGSLYDFTPSAPASLTQNTTYWVVLGGTGAGSNVSWDFTLDSPFTPVGSSTLYARSISGDPWEILDIANTEPQLMAVETTPVPEPEMAVGASALILLGWSVWRTNRVQRGQVCLVPGGNGNSAKNNIWGHIS